MRTCYGAGHLASSIRRSDDASDALKLRYAIAQDSPGVLRAYEWLFEPPGTRPSDWDPTVAAARFHRAISSDRSAIILAELNRSLVGVASVYMDIESIRFGQFAWIEDLAVHPDHRSKGIGAVLLRESIDWARRNGARRVGLTSAEARADAHRFYMSHRPSWRSICFGWDLGDA